MLKTLAIPAALVASVLVLHAEDRRAVPTPVEVPQGQIGGSGAGPENVDGRKHDNEKTEGDLAVLRGLRWLARHQNPDGSWSSDGFSVRCVNKACAGRGHDTYNAGVTGLALLAFMRAGYGPDSEDSYVDGHTGRTMRRGEVVKLGLKWLIEEQKQDGRVGDQKNFKYMYDHAISTMALVQAAKMTDAKKYKAAAESAVDYLVAAQNQETGWRYSKNCGDNDTSVTSWCAMALKAADDAGFRVPKRAYAGILSWIEATTDKEYCRVGYTARGTGKVIIMGQNEEWQHHETLTAVGMLCRMQLGDGPGDEAVKGGAKLLVSDLPNYKEHNVDAYYWYYGTLALREFGKTEPKYWAPWKKATLAALTENQRKKKDGCSDGSWDAEDDRWACEGGLVYTTAINVLTLVANRE